MYQPHREIGEAEEIDLEIEDDKVLKGKLEQ